MDEQTLEPCPFCGNDEPVLEKVSALSRLSAVFCNTCEISGEKMSTAEAAIAAWNRRAAHSVIAGKVAELTGLLAEAQLLFALGVGAMTDNGDKDNQERCVRDAGELNLRISKALAPYPERRSE